MPGLSSRSTITPSPLVPYAAFAAFGVFWGTWGAALPAIRSQAGVTEGELGTALLFVAVGALPAMFLTGRRLDRVGARLAAPLLASLGLTGLLLSVSAKDLTWLIVGMLLVGATSGAADVAINTVTGRVEQETGRPLLTRAHGVFSLAVVVSSLVGGAAQSNRSAQSNGSATPGAVLLTFALAAGVMLALSLLVWIGTSFNPAHAGSASPTSNRAKSLGPDVTAFVAKSRSAIPVPLILVGLVGALAYATENAHQSWGAVFLTDSFTASTQTASLAPATFAAAAALTRLTLAPLSRTQPLLLLLGGGAVATLGSLLLASSPSPTIALVGLAIAAAGTATLFPTLLSSSLRHADPARRGRATSVISITAYLGFLLGPAYVGLLAQGLGLRSAIVGVAALALAFTVTGAPVSQWAAKRLADPLERARSRVRSDE